MADLEQPRLKVGFIPIIDCAPVVLAEELGAFERQGLEVEIRREVSWANVRDKLALGVLDASHILAPLPLAITLGVDSVTVPLVNVMTLEVNGNALTLSQALWREMEEAAPDLVASGHAPLVARALAAVVRKRAAAGAPQVVLASVFPYSPQNYMVRLWLSSGGLDPDRDVRLTVVPPPHTVAHLSGGVVDGYCVGEPWNQRSVVLGIGRVALTGPDIWKGMPEKVLGTTEAWAGKNPETLKALIKALLEASQWLDEPGNRAEAARLLASPRYLNTPAEVISRTLDLPDFHVFHRNHANFPWRSHADWFLKQMVRWGQASPSIDIEATSDRVYRTDLFRAAAREMGVACPEVDRLPPGGHGEPLVPAFEPMNHEFPASLRLGD
ncbi:CmpA/NrtA family ABC transporter substrate-binding protein [Reyranella sp.]|uniref:CmpA/NrtA family ABC transporter substrate-binding protein n=1 Tax=Reyranella sp. TaxID=1929291 RepID=UPI003D0D4674